MDFSKLDQYIDQQPDKGIPCMDVSVFHHGRCVHRHIMGTCDYQKKKPLTEKNLNWLYSGSKVMTMCAVMQLIDRGELSLDEKLGDLIPAFAEMKVMTADGGVVPAKNPILIRHLMSMSAGLDYDLRAPALLEVCRDLEADTATIVNAIAEKPLHFEPGTSYRYSLCHDVMARVIEVKSGKRFSEYLKENIWQPLDMRDITFRDETQEIRDRLVAQFKYDNDTFTSKPDYFVNEYKLSNCYESGGAGIITSAEDYGKFVAALSNKGVSADGHRILSMDSINTWRFTLLPDDILKDTYSKYKIGYSYALGVRSMKHPEWTGAKSPIGEFGWDGAAGAFVLLDPDNEIGLYIAMQVKGCAYAYFDMHLKVRDFVYEILLGK